MDTRITLTNDELAALEAMDLSALSARIEDCLDYQTVSWLANFKLTTLGESIYRLLLDFRSNVDALSGMRSAKQVADGYAKAKASGDALYSAIVVMRENAIRQLNDAKRFRVDDMPPPPASFDSRLSVGISFSWRMDSEENWHKRAVEFVAIVSDTEADWLKRMRGDLGTKAELENFRQVFLADEWRSFACHAIRMVYYFLEQGGDGAVIPARQEVVWGASRRIPTDRWGMPEL